MNTATKNTLGDKFKSKERDMRAFLPAGSIVGLRLDGKAFHTFTKQFARPFDEKFMDAMNAAAINVVEALSGVLFAYVQSDEITVIFTDKTSAKAELAYAGRIEKILSTTASAATGGFLKALPEVDGVPMFDARLFLLDDMTEVLEYMDWRRLDARKNAVSMAAGALFSHKSLLNKSTRDRAGMLKGTEFETLPDGFFNGRLVVKESFEDTVTYKHGKTGEIITQDVTRYFWVPVPALRDLTQDTVNTAAANLV